MKFTTSDGAGMEIAERVVSCVSIAFDDLHQRTADRWSSLAMARPHIMNAVILDELKQEFAGDADVQSHLNRQLRTFHLPNQSLTFRVKKQRQGKLQVSSNDTVRDQKWGLSLSQLPLPVPEFESHERLVLTYSVSTDWQLLESVAFMEFQNSECVALERLSLVPEVIDSPMDVESDPTRFKPSIYRINPDKVERIEVPGLILEDEDEVGS